MINLPPLKPGDLVYRVVEHDPPNDRTLHTWRIATGTVKTATKRVIIFTTYLPGTSNRQYDPRYYGHAFHATPTDAIAAFMVEQAAEVESAKRAIATAERALAWCKAQSGGGS